MPLVLEHEPGHHDRGHRQHHERGDRQEVRPGRWVLERVGRVGAEEAATVGAGLLDRHQGGHRAAGDRLGFHLGRGAVEGRRLGRRLERHRHPRPDQQDGDDHGDGNENEDKPAHQVEVEVAHVRVATQAAQGREHDAKAGGRGDEHQPDDAGQLAEIRQVLLARVVLEVRVGHERADRVEHDAGIGAGMIDARRVFVAQSGERALTVGVEGQALLGVEQAEGQDEQRGIERQQGEAIPFPVHSGRLAASEQTAEEHRYRIEPLAGAIGRRIERSKHRPPERNRHRDRHGEGPKRVQQ